MKRICCSIVFLVAVVCVDGCKRSRGIKRDAVGVQKETDFIFAARPDEEFKNLIPPPPPPPTPEKVDAAVQEAISKAKADAEKAKRLAETFALGQEFTKFCAATTGKDQSLDKFKTYLRRAKLDDLRREVDGGGMQVFFISAPAPSGHIVAMHKSTVDDFHPIYVIGAAGADLLKPDPLTVRIQEQELNVMWRHYCDFALGHFVSTPSDPRDVALYKKIFNPYTPTYTLTLIGQQMPKYVRNPPEKRNLGAFKKHLRDNARPDVLIALEKNDIRVNMNADLRAAKDLVACLKDTEKGHPTALSDGAVGYYPGAVIEPRFSDPVAPPP